MKRLEKYDTFPISVSKIHVDYDANCRGYFTLESVEALAKDIGRKGFPYGLETPVVVRPLPGGTYHLVCGHRRFTACVKLLKWAKIPAQVRELSDDEAADLNFTENLHRTNLNILQEAQYIGRVYEGLPAREVAKRIEQTVEWVLRRRKLLILPEEVQMAAAAGTISAACVELIGRLNTVEEQLDALSRYKKVKRKGKTAPFTELPEKFQPGFRGRKSKGQIANKISYLFDRGITSGLPTRALAWAAAQITDEQLEPDIDEYLAMLKELEEWRTGQRH